MHVGFELGGCFLSSRGRPGSDREMQLEHYFIVHMLIVSALISVRTHASICMEII